MAVEVLLVLHGRQVADGAQQAVVIEPPDPFQGGEFYVVESSPGTMLPDHLSLVQPDERFAQGVVVTVTSASYGRLDACLGQPFGIADAEILGGFKASRARSLRRDRETRQPTIRRLNASMTNAT